MDGTWTLGSMMKGWLINVGPSVCVARRVSDMDVEFGVRIAGAGVLGCFCRCGFQSVRLGAC